MPKEHNFFEIEKAQDFMRHAYALDADVSHELGYSVVLGLIAEAETTVRHNAPEFLVKVVDPCSEKLTEYSKAEVEEITRAMTIAEKMARALIDLRRANGVKNEADEAAKQAGHKVTLANASWRTFCMDLKNDFMPA